MIGHRHKKGRNQRPKDPEGHQDNCMALIHKLGKMKGDYLIVLASYDPLSSIVVSPFLSLFFPSPLPCSPALLFRQTFQLSSSPRESTCRGCFLFAASTRLSSPHPSSESTLLSCSSTAIIQPKHILL